MTVHRQLILLLIVAAMAIVPATASAASGGATPGEITLPGDPPTVVRIGNQLLRARTADISISTRASSHVRGRVRIDGTVPAGTTAGVRIERRDAQRGWVVVATATVADDGAFHAVWRPRRAGGFTL